MVSTESQYIQGCHFAPRTDPSESFGGSDTVTAMRQRSHTRHDRTRDDMQGDDMQGPSGPWGRMDLLQEDRVHLRFFVTSHQHGIAPPFKRNARDYDVEINFINMNIRCEACGA